VAFGAFWDFLSSLTTHCSAWCMFCFGHFLCLSLLFWSAAPFAAGFLSPTMSNAPPSKPAGVDAAICKIPAPECAQYRMTQTMLRIKVRCGLSEAGSPLGDEK
jgi:hypothetical protein